MSRWYFQPIFDSYLLVVLLSLALAILTMSSFGPLSAGRRRTLMFVRAMVIGLVCLAMLRPIHVSTKTRPKPSTLILMLDRSRSMQIADRAQGQTRWEAQCDTLTAVLPQLRDLYQEMEVLLYAFDSAAHALEFDGEQVVLDQGPNGDESDIGSSLDDAIGSAAGKRLAGVILMSDGAQRALHPRVDIQQPARELARLGYPLYTIAVGLSRDQAQARDVAIENLPDQYTVFVKNELEIRALLRAHGYVNQQIPVELIVQSPDGEKETLGPISLQPTANRQQLEVRFTYTPEKPGQYRLAVQAAKQPGELVTDNNQLSAFLTVLDGGLRVLYLYGSVASGQRWECESIGSSPDMQLDHMWVDQRGRQDWPLDLNQRFGGKPYDVYLLGDLDSTALGQLNCGALAKEVARGKGLFMLGGYHSFGPGGYRDTPLSQVLPVKMGRFERQQFDAPRRADRHLNRKLVLVPTRSHFITHLASGSQNEVLWRRLPPLFGANKFTGFAANAQILVTSSREDPILVAGVYGRGRVLALAADSLAPWYRYGFQSEHKRFWRQAILWLARKEDSMRDGVWVRLDQRRFGLGGQVTFAAGANSPDGDPLTDVTFEAKVTGPDGTQQPARLAPAAEEWTGRFNKLSLPGDYQIDVVGRRNGEVVGSAQQQFMVLDQDLELSDPAANPQQLEQLASLTREAGGKALAPEQLPALLKQIKEKPPTMEIDFQSKWQLADTELDAWLFFLCVIGLLCIEWFLRKKWRLA